MKRPALVLAFLIGCAVPASAQLTATGVGGGFGAAGGGFTPSCTASTNFLARATGITLTADKTNYDTLICGMVTDGTFAKMDAVYIFSAPDSTTAKLNLIQNAFNGTTTLSFSAYNGFTGDGTTVFDTGLTPSSGGTNYVLNSASLGAYVLTSDATASGAGIMGSNNTNDTEILLQPASSGNFFCRTNGGTFGALAMTNSRAFWQCSSDASTIGNSKNGAALTTAASTPSGLGNVTITAFCRHDGSGAVYGACVTYQMSAVYIGGALTNTDVANVSSRINAFMTAYSINAY